MASIKDRLLALEAMRPLNNAGESWPAADYAARVLIAFLDEGDKAQAMMRRGVAEDEARRFARMGFRDAQREVMARVHNEVAANRRKGEF